MLEENFYTLADFGLLSHPVEDYYWVLIGSYMAISMPCWMPIYLFVCYKFFSNFIANLSKKKKPNFEQDPEFEADETVDVLLEASAKENSSKAKKSNKKTN